MASDVTREEFSHVVARVEVVEREVDGEKLVTRYILEQTRRNGDDLAAIKTRLDRVESRLDAVNPGSTGLSNRSNCWMRRSRIWSGTCPEIVSDAVRQVLAER